MKKMKLEVSEDLKLHIEQMRDALAGVSSFDPGEISYAQCGQLCEVTCSHYCWNNCDDVCLNSCESMCEGYCGGIGSYLIGGCISMEAIFQD